MTKKDYEMVASVLKSEHDIALEFNPTNCLVIRQIAYALADIFAVNNPRFDRRKFMDAAI